MCYQIWHAKDLWWWYWREVWHKWIGSYVYRYGFLTICWLDIATQLRRLVIGCI